ncbi:hypothetical protein SAMN05660359_02533 [Geodermatophilus obscurus]|uniref:Uncharacterized protein n=1 Tax=Geodermatophilus obscurus TaxID=1861 RepID=A0A1I5G491_9ACTN|nr:hypothetical protein SAMN05660359_02533 [Geodermatophilus obscurus]
MPSSAPSLPTRLIISGLCALLEALIPPRKRAMCGRTGRSRVSDRDRLEDIAFVLSTDIG